MEDSSSSTKTDTPRKWEGLDTGGVLVGSAHKGRERQPQKSKQSSKKRKKEAREGEAVGAKRGLDLRD